MFLTLLPVLTATHFVPVVQKGMLCALTRPTLLTSAGSKAIYVIYIVRELPVMGPEMVTHPVKLEKKRMNKISYNLCCLFRRNVSVSSLRRSIYLINSPRKKQIIFLYYMAPRFSRAIVLKNTRPSKSLSRQIVFTEP